ncbi:hypothetical protein BCR37DRAFT_386433 [Protomyces lactucae-debilis]|uniref:F-box domain-containing protein n=1 Tax=Protomyces lactucae-debilis TaxID=2754530 RepID=A0A1Y2FLK3_PROLT|nr:uncharacterized protein BCR37DRAFT_386433 [Protomyces lactucae-debilis]ORY84234.1 hypothetical protein BCR37DRAFT_386433 [Protomyces lactucae-debilis]
MSLPNLPTEVWWQILRFTDTKTLWPLRRVSRAFLRCIEDKLVSEILATDKAKYLMSKYTGDRYTKWYQADESPVRMLNMAAKQTFVYAAFNLSQSTSAWDHYQFPVYTWENWQEAEAEREYIRRNTIPNDWSLENAIRLSIWRDSDLRDLPLQTPPLTYDELHLSKVQIRRHIMVSEDSQSLLVPIYLLWAGHFECVEAPMHPDDFSLDATQRKTERRELYYWTNEGYYRLQREPGD